jgi:hypothetical protein
VAAVLVEVVVAEVGLLGGSFRGMEDTDNRQLNNRLS